MAEPVEYPNDGEQLGGDYYPKARDADKRELEDKVKKVKAETSYPILDDLVKWFDEQIAEVANVDSIEIKELKIGGFTYSTKLSVEAQVLGMKWLKDKFVAKKAEYKNWKDELDDIRPK